MGKKQDLSKKRMEALRRGDLETADKLLQELMPRQRRDREAHQLEKEALRARRSKKLRDRNTYDVVAGDSFFSVASEVLGDARLAGALIEANPNVYVLHPGMVLDLPELDTESEDPPLFSEEAYRDALISQELVDAIGGDPSGARVGDEDVEIEADEEFVQDSQEALAGLGLEEEALAEAVANLLINLGYDYVPEPRPREMPVAQEEEDIDEETFGRPDRETEEYLGAEVSLEEGLQQEGTPPPPDDGGKRGTKKRDGLDGVKPGEEIEPAVVPTEEVEPTEVVEEPLPSYEELVIAAETDWLQWENALENSGIELRDDEGELNIEEISTFIAEDIEVNKERYAQELGMTVDELAEVSSGRVAGWLAAVETHNLQDRFSVRTLMEQTDQEIFGFSIDVQLDPDDEFSIVSIDDYANIYKGTPEQLEIKTVKDNIGAASTMIAFALFRVAVANEMDIGNTPQEVFQAVFGNPQFQFTDNPDKYGTSAEAGDFSTCFASGGGINCTTNFVDDFASQLGGHEFGHVLRGRIQIKYSLEIPDELSEDEKLELLEINEYRASLLSPYNNLANSDLEYLDENGVRNTEPYQEDTEEVKWQWHTAKKYGDSANRPNEIFGEMFLAWAFDAFADNDDGEEFFNWMEEMMPVWMAHASEEYSDSWLEE